MQMGRMRWVAAMAVVALVSVGGAAPAPAGPLPESFNEIFDSFPLTVNGSYTPLIGDLDCTAGEGDLGIIWYAPGSSADWIWRDISLAGPGDVEYSSGSLSVNGTFEPFVGDFDGDGCDDVFWYAPGSAADFVWYGVDGGGFTSRAVTVNGDYTPLVGNFDLDTQGADIYWYGSGGGTESIWRGSATRGTFGVSTAPQVAGTDFIATSDGGGALFYRPGTGADYIWEDILAGATAPGDSIQINITRTYQPFYAAGGFYLYRPGTATDILLYDYAEDGSLTTIPGTINGTFRVAVLAPTQGGQLILFHAPGSAQDYLWAATK